MAAMGNHSLAIASVNSGHDLRSQISTILGLEVVNTGNEDNFQRTIWLLPMDAKELSWEISYSVEKVSYLVLYAL